MTPAGMAQRLLRPVALLLLSLGALGRVSSRGADPGLAPLRASLYRVTFLRPAPSSPIKFSSRRGRATANASAVTGSARRTHTVPPRPWMPRSSTRLSGATSGRSISFRAQLPFDNAPKLGYSFSVAGLIFPYHLGVIEELKDAGKFSRGVPLAGSSGGALAAAFTALELDPHVAIEATGRVCDAIRASGKSSRGQLGRLLKEELSRVLPEDAHERLNAWEGGCIVGVTLLQPLPTAVYIDTFTSRQDLVDVLACSCHIPFWCSSWPLTRCRRTLGADGFFSSTATFGCPPTRAETTVCVSPFRASSVFPQPAAGAGARSMQAARGFGGGIISPELLPQERRGRPQDLLPVALEPAPNNAFFQELFEDGRRDARQWMRNEYKDSTN